MSSAPPPTSYTGQPVAPVAPVATAVPVTNYQTAPVAPMAPAPMQTAPQVAQEYAAARETHHPNELRIYSHSNFFYWWPVWVTGYIMALATYIDGHKVLIGDTEVWMHRSKNVGVLFTLTFFLVILITNVSLRGLASVVALLALAFGALLLAYLGLWEDVL